MDIPVFADADDSDHGRPERDGCSIGKRGVDERADLHERLLRLEARHEPLAIE